MKSVTDKLRELKGAMDAFDEMMETYRTSVIEGKTGADERLREDVERLRRELAVETRSAHDTGIRVMENVSTIREDVTRCFREVSRIVRVPDTPVLRSVSDDDLDTLMDRFYTLEADMRSGSPTDGDVEEFRAVFRDIIRALDRYDEGARQSFARAVSEAEDSVDDGIRRAMGNNRLETEELILRAKAQLEDMVNTLGEFLVESFPSDLLEGYRRDFSTRGSDEGFTVDPVNAAVSLDLRGNTYSRHMDALFESHFGDLYDSGVITLPLRMTGQRSAGVLFSYDNQRRDQVLDVLRTLSASVIGASEPGTASVIVYDPAGSIGGDDAVNPQLRITRNPAELLGAVTSVLERIEDPEDAMAVCQMFLMDFPAGVDANLLDLIDTFTDLPFGGVSVNLFFNTSLGLTGSAEEMERLAQMADRFTESYTAGDGVFTDSNGFPCVCAWIGKEVNQE